MKGQALSRHAADAGEALEGHDELFERCGKGQGLALLKQPGEVHPSSDLREALALDLLGAGLRVTHRR